MLIIDLGIVYEELTGLIWTFCITWSDDSRHHMLSRKYRGIYILDSR